MMSGVQNAVRMGKGVRQTVTFRPRISFLYLTITALFVLNGTILFQEIAFCQVVEERPDRDIPTAETIGEKAVFMAQNFCDQRGWDWSKVRSHSYKDALTIWHPSAYGGSDSLTFNVRTGALISECTMKKSDTEGVREYIGKYYYRDGTVVEISYRDDKPHGVKRIYYANGTLKAEIPYRDGKKQGIEKRYDPEGNLVREIKWEGNVSKQPFAEVD